MFKFCLNMFQHLLIYRGPTLHKSFGSSIKVFLFRLWTDNFQVDNSKHLETHPVRCQEEIFYRDTFSGGATNVILQNLLLFLF
jgi:hypothetical protein